MSWARGTDSNGNAIGYAVKDKCHAAFCSAAIDRGLAYVCGGEHEGGEHGCGGYFCDQHMFFNHSGPSGPDRLVSPQLCEACSRKWTDAHPTPGAVGPHARGGPNAIA
jgi:hypothetical protein